MKTFRAWIDEAGWNRDRDHRTHHCTNRRFHRYMCNCLRLVDYETDEYRTVLRLVWRRRPFYFVVVLFFDETKGRRVFRVGRKNA